MSYEGYTQKICINKHLSVFDAYFDMYNDSLHVCFCKQPFAFICNVDETNGQDDNYPESIAGKVKEVGFEDDWKIDHYGNKYAIKILHYIPDDPKRWKVIK